LGKRGLYSPQHQHLTTNTFFFPMRWIWIDKFIQFESGKRAVAVKNVSLAEEHLHDHFPGFPIHPPSLVIEGMAQTAGILVGEARQFSEKVILAKIKKAIFHDYAYPGDQIEFEAIAEDISETGANTTGIVRKRAPGSTETTPLAEIDLMFSHVDNNLSGLKFPAHNFVFTEQFKSLLAHFTANSE
jgi:3-hydroxyacyl-[acyl-carrier-protein] dehydratase